MALDHDQLRRRRQQREAQRKAKKRKTVLKLMIAGAVLLVCGVVIAVITLGGREKPEPAQPAETETTAYVQNLTTLRLAAVGDINITEKVVNAGGGTYDYSALFLDVAHLLADADVTVANLEGTLCGPPYGANRAAPPQLAQSLAQAGVDAVQVANSYSMQGGNAGLQQTLSGVRTAGLIPLGAFESNEAFQNSRGYTLIQVQGLKIALVAFTKGMGGTALLPGNEDCVNLLYTDYTSTYQQIDTQGIQSILDAVAEEKPDLTVAMLHWGSEYNDTISKSQQSICTLMQNGGVDVILGTHSHFLQKMELNPETGKFVAYSLGDFVGDGEKAGSNYSVILELEITRDNDAGTTAITGFSYTPVYIVEEEGKPLRVMRIREAVAAYEAGQLDRVSQQTYEGMLYALERIEKRITGA